MSDLAGKKVFVRVDWNVPIAEGAVVDDFRMRASIPTIEYLLNAGAEIQLATHLADKTFDTQVLFAYAVAHFGWEKYGGCVAMLPNLRANAGEEANDDSFARALAKGIDLYVNDAFAVSHRAHASVVGVPKYVPIACGGFLLEKEVRELSRVFTPEHPFVAVLGGAKFDTKLPLVRRFVEVADTIFISGALCVEFFRSKGYEMGCSLASTAFHDVGEFLHNPKIRLPVDVVTQSREVKTPESVGKDDMVLDVGPATLREMEESVKSAKLTVWNGPLGKYEDGFVEATDEFANMLAVAPGYSILGGGDTIASLEKLNILDKIGFVSTGGGAMLDFLANKTLPGIEVLSK